MCLTMHKASMQAMPTPGSLSQAHPKLSAGPHLLDHAQREHHLNGMLLQILCMGLTQLLPLPRASMPALPVPASTICCVQGPRAWYACHVCECMNVASPA